MPALSPTMTVGNVATWVKNEGDQVAAGDILADIETDKATLGFDSQEDGYLAKILVPAGTQNVAVGTVIAVLCDDAADVPKFANFSSSSAPSAPPPTEAPALPPPFASSAPTAHVDLHSVKMGPAARFHMQQQGFSLEQVDASGPQGMITKADVLAAVAGGVKSAPAPQPQAAPVAPAAKSQAAPAAKGASRLVSGPTSRKRFGEPHTDVPNSAIRKIIAGRLLESKTTIPHLYMALDADLDAVLALRKELAAAGTKVSVNDCVIKAVALALREVPEANNYWSECEGVSESSGVDISMAVSTDKGLITPIIKGADLKTLAEIAADSKRLAGRARENKLTPEEFQGGSFSISNLGMFPVDKFCAIINPPQACIMAVGRGVPKVVMGTGGKLATVISITVTISADHRVFNGDVGAKFLNAFRENIEKPGKMML